ncbi:uncharacterized protein LOC131934892 [Physella acuta]|uniref:uncharacterized protein LOC131934892 n=1 Tax=Physella acuta TaxID=109671 RepID=UPI0027DC75F0|nr:uncharacterized protein LOC131934892 [Physella acuta]
MHATLFIVIFSLAVLCGVNAVTCPVCSDPYDHTTCTGTQDCQQGHEVCEMRVDTGDRNKLEYHCAHTQQCQDQEDKGCDAANRQHCIYCCIEPAPCKVLRDNLFMNTFTPSP